MAGKDIPVPIISYHAIGDEKSPVFLSKSEFERQIKSLASHGYETADISPAIFQQANESQKTCVICFDDCYESVYSIAASVMEQYGLTGVLYVVTEYCGRQNNWTGQPDSVPRAPLMSWDQIEDLASRGWQIGSHSRTHRDLTRLTLEELNDEVGMSAEVIQKRIGVKSSSFCFPYGLSNDRVRDEVRMQYDTAVGTTLKLASQSDDCHDLPRIDSYYLSVYEGDVPLSSPGWQSYLAARQTLRTIKRWFVPDVH